MISQTHQHSTPWGPSQQTRVIADGITRYDTASHGGYHLSPDRMIEFRAIFPDFKLFAGDGWFEEDQDWSLVALAFPHCFSQENIYHAVETVKCSMSMGRDRGWSQVAQVIKGTLPDRIAEEFQASHAAFWQVGSASTQGQGWRVSLRRVGDGARREVLFSDYPVKGFYSDADLAVGEGESVHLCKICGEPSGNGTNGCADCRYWCDGNF